MEKYNNEILYLIASRKFLLKVMFMNHLFSFYVNIFQVK